MILVTGATGQLGRATLNFLRQTVPPADLAALVRDPAKGADLAGQGIALRVGDYNDYPSLVTALQDVDKLLLVSAVAFTDRFAQHANVIAAAQEAGVPHVVYTSVQRKNDTLSPIPGITDSDMSTEQRLRASGLRYTILRNTLYTDTLPYFLGAGVLSAGVAVPAQPQPGRIPFASRHDLAEAAAAVLTQLGHENQTYTLTGAEAVSFADIARLLSELAGAAVPYHEVSREAFVARLAGEGFPPPVAEFFGQWMDACNHGVFEDADPALERLLGRRPTPVRDMLRAIYFAKQPA